LNGDGLQAREDISPPSTVRAVDAYGIGIKVLPALAAPLGQLPEEILQIVTGPTISVPRHGDGERQVLRQSKPVLQGLWARELVVAVRHEAYRRP